MSSAGLSESRGSVGCTSRYFMPAWWSITRIFADQERAEMDNDLKLDSRETARRLNAKRMKKPINDAGNKGLYKCLQCERKTHNNLLL